MNNTFANKLSNLRIGRGFSSTELAHRAEVPESLICGLQKQNRVIGEYAARKIGKALQLSGRELEDFVYLAINNCSEKVLQSFKGYPAEVLNLIAGELYASGISANKISRCVRHPKGDDANAALYLDDGTQALIKLEVAYR